MTNETTKTYENCTMYYSGEFFGNYNQIECKYVKVTIAPYAQYDSAVRVEYLEKGKRKPRTFTQCYKPSLVIAKGWNCAKPADMFGGPGKSSTGMIVRQSTYSSFDEGWKNDFVRDIMPQLTVLADFHGHNSMDRFDN